MVRRIDWDKRRYEIAKDMLRVTSTFQKAGMLCKVSKEEASRLAVEYADALIEELKKGGNDDKGRGGGILRLTRESNQMLREIVIEMRNYLNPNNVNKRNMEDFMRSVNANLCSDKLIKKYGL